MIVKGIVKHFGRLIKKAEENIIAKMTDGRLDTEPSVTERFLQEIESVFEEYGEKDGIIFRVRTLRDRGANSPEKEFGADFCGVLDIKLPELEQSKGFLAQAKSERQGIRVDKRPYGLNAVSFPTGSESNRLRSQAIKMLSVTPDSFIIIYSISGFMVVPASAIQGIRHHGLLNQVIQLYGKPVDRFFKEFIMCFIGDPKLKAYDDQTLKKLRENMEARFALLFQIKES
ncbi:MAG: hypothetical protein KAT53_07990 [Dehalococcoidia bacterium]|nr:hypothetical protein [Dehalococcoidia bacterium]